MDKCEWKDGKFKPCEAFNGAIGTISFVQNDNGSFVRCEHCKCSISKPEPEVIIKKSGETWVALYEGIDYLWIWKGEPSLSPPVDYFLSCVPRYWKPISEIEITDEIAKLRPIVVWNENNSDKLTGWNKKTVNMEYTTLSRKMKTFPHIRLATVEDL